MSSLGTIKSVRSSCGQICGKCPPKRSGAPPATYAREGSSWKLVRRQSSGLPLFRGTIKEMLLSKISIAAFADTPNSFPVWYKTGNKRKF